MPTPPHPPVSPRFSAPRREGSRDRSGSDASQERTWRRASEAAPGPTSPSAAGDAPRERPRLVLAPRSSQTAEGDSAKPSAVFGAARPREEVLKERGIDPVKEQLKAEHKAVARWVGARAQVGGGVLPLSQHGAADAGSNVVIDTQDVKPLPTRPAARPPAGSPLLRRLTCLPASPSWSPR